MSNVRSVGRRDSSSKIAEISETFRIYRAIGILVTNDRTQSRKAGSGLTHPPCADNIAHVLACWSVQQNLRLAFHNGLWGASAAG